MTASAPCVGITVDPDVVRDAVAVAVAVAHSAEELIDAVRRLDRTETSS